MTERRRRPRPRVVIAGAVATFLALLALLSFQLRAGQDPALGAGRQIAALPAWSHGAKIVTRASGGAASAAQPAGAPHTRAPVISRASGAGGGGDDE
jgi:hypothetical protein